MRLVLSIAFLDTFLALIILRICSLPEDRNKRHLELKSLLLTRGYTNKLIDAAIDKAVQIPRSDALKRVVKTKTSQRTVFAITFDPRLPSITVIVKKTLENNGKGPPLS